MPKIKSPHLSSEIPDEIKFEAAKLLDNFSLEDYLTFRRKHPELEITLRPRHDLNWLFQLLDELLEFGIEQQVFAKMLDGNVWAIDELCLLLIERLVERRKIEKSGEAHVQSRRKVIPDSLVQFLIVLMFESCQLHKISPTSSLVILATEMLGGHNSERKTKRRLEQKKEIAARIVARKPKITNRELEAKLGIDHSTLSRWRKEGDFIGFVEMLTKYPLPNRDTYFTEDEIVEEWYRPNAAKSKSGQSKNTPASKQDSRYSGLMDLRNLLVEIRKRF